MALQDYVVDGVIRVVYQAPSSVSGLLDVTMVIYDETGALDGVDFPDVIMTEVGTTGKYRGSFTPDTPGEWEVHIAHTSGTLGKSIKQFSVGGFNLDAVGTLVTSNEAAIVAVDAVVDSILLEVTANSIQLTDIENAVNDIDTPPVIG